MTSKSVISTWIEILRDTKAGDWGEAVAGWSIAVEVGVGQRLCPGSLVLGWAAVPSSAGEQVQALFRHQTHLGGE